ncbi:hypothetical protein [Candidatus Berkiella aquae]|uniref:Uncharacterized protein n=1 Tax=Candidatus Berkiella aquae TaxID=295108 RepID=A0A0Q9Z0L4_9GAMM|nr:hypothetical protein [Candidatus Berkiella aquae]MCS5711842.1 hypothetical protein [Candidatus Berkiella aquae]
MKSGVTNHSRKKTVVQNSNNMLTEYSLGSLMLPDVLAYTLQYVPCYQLVGANKLSSVSKSWQKTLNVSHFAPVKFERILDECRKDPQRAIAILTDETLHPYLDLEKTIALAGCCSEFAKHLLSKNKKYGCLMENVDLLGQNNVEVAQDLLGMDLLSQTMLVSMGKKLPEVAMMILNSNYVRNFAAEHLCQIGKEHREVVRTILDTKEFYDRLTRKNLSCLAELVQNFSDIAMSILISTEKLSGNELAILGQKCLDVANHILNTEALSNKLTEENLATLGQFLPEIAIRVLNTRDLSEASLVKLAHTQKAALHILQTKELMNKLSLGSIQYLGGMHSEFAVFILNNPLLCEQLTGTQILMLAKCSSKVAMHIVSTQKLLEKLPKQSDYLFEVFSRYPSVMTHIRNTPSLIALKKNLEFFEVHPNRFQKNLKCCSFIFAKAKTWAGPKTSTLHQLNGVISDFRVKWW